MNKTPQSRQMMRLAELSHAMPAPAEFQLVLDEITNGTDRASVLLASSIIDYHLEASIKKSFARKLNETVYNSMFRNSGPLASSMAKVNMAYAMGAVGPKTRDILSEMAKIRNAFAHSIYNVSYDTPEIIAAINKIKSVDIASECLPEQTDPNLSDITSPKLNSLFAFLMIVLSLYAFQLKKTEPPNL